MKTRESSIDLAKLFAGLLVVYGHILLRLIPTSDLLLTCVTSSHMPLFFTCSGYFLYSELSRYSGRELCRRKFFRLLIPYVIWSAISLGFHFILMVAQDSANLLPQFIREASDIFIFARSVWFLVVMFVSQILLIVIFSISLKCKVPLVLLASIAYLIGVFLFPNEVLSMFRFKWLFPFLVLGFYLAKSKSVLSGFDAVFMRGGWIVLIIFPIYTSFALSGSEAPFWKLTIYNISLQRMALCAKYLIASILGMASIYYIAKVAAKCRLGMSLAKYGEYTLDTYVIHIPFLVFVGLIPKTLGKLQLYILSLSFAICLVGGICIVSRYVLRRNKLYNYSVGMYQQLRPKL